MDLREEEEGARVFASRDTVSAERAPAAVQTDLPEDEEDIGDLRSNATSLVMGSSSLTPL